MPNEIDFDKHGHCSLCHKILHKIIMAENKPVEVFTSEAVYMELQLNDGSKTRVLICKTCKGDYDPGKDSKNLMNSIIKGWSNECDTLVADQSKPQFDQAWKEAHMEVYSKKEIIS